MSIELYIYEILTLLFETSNFNWINWRESIMWIIKTDYDCANVVQQFVKPITDSIMIISLFIRANNRKIGRVCFTNKMMKFWILNSEMNGSSSQSKWCAAYLCKQHKFGALFSQQFYRLSEHKQVKRLYNSLPPAASTDDGFFGKCSEHGFKCTSDIIKLHWITIYIARFACVTIFNQFEVFGCWSLMAFY